MDCPSSVSIPVKIKEEIINSLDFYFKSRFIIVLLLLYLLCGLYMQTVQKRIKAISSVRRKLFGIERKALTVSTDIRLQVE